MTDAPAVEILPPVTDKRHSQSGQSDNRNDSIDQLTPDACHDCREPFEHGQTRFPVSGRWNELVSVCGLCFKDGCIAPGVNDPPRHNLRCKGCGAPIHSPTKGRFRWQVCSDRCRQREYRKRRRENGGSTVSWKYQCTPQCAACKQPISGKRKDARFCSARCKQWAHRRRHA